MTSWHSRLVVQRSQLGRSVAISLVLRIVALMITAWTDSGRMIRIYTLASNKRRENSLLSVSSQLVDIVIMIVLIHIRYLWQSNLITRI
jgi:protein subunit release factor B